MTEKGKQKAMRLLLDYKTFLQKNSDDPSIYEDKKIAFPVVWVVGDSVLITFNAAIRAQRNMDYLVDGRSIFREDYVTKHQIENLTWEKAFEWRYGRKPTKQDCACVDKYIAQKGGLLAYEKYGHNVPYYQRSLYNRKDFNNN